MKHSTARLSEVARHVIAPAGITATSWPSVRATCAAMGLEFDRWQDDLGKLICAKRGGTHAADMFAMSIPRQTGKTYLLGALTFALCVKQPGLTAIWTAHRTRTAAETFKHMQGLARRDKIAPHVAGVLTGNGKEEVRFTNGSRILFGARERGFGRGFAGVDVLIFDEAQILSESAMDDMVPATNAAADPLILFAGTPPKPTDPGEVFTMLRAEALAGEVDDVGYVEISADRGSDQSDRGQWRKMNPSFPHRTSERAILRMLKALGSDSFEREARGIWDEFTVHQPVVKAARWAELVDVGPDGSVKPDALAVDMSHGRDISIAAAWCENDSTHLEEVWAGVDTAAAVEWLTEKAGRRIPVVVDSVGPAASLTPELRARKCKVRATNGADMARACGLFENAVNADALTHGGQKTLGDALQNARKRPIRDAGGWGWDRRDPNSPIHPLVAATLALLGATENQRASGGGATFA
jgi:phage terminase large subunit-like protein